MKKKLLVIFLMSLLLVSWCKNWNNNKDILFNNSYVSWWNKEILYLTGKTTWDKVDEQKFRKQLSQMLVDKSYNTWTGISEIARLYDYLGYVWASTVVYENWIKKWWKDPLSIHHNIAWLYKKLCRNKLSSKNYSAIKYCRKSINEYYYLINKYKKLVWYKDIVEVLIYMWEINKAKQVYDVYLKKWWKKDSLIEKKLR